MSETNDSPQPTFTPPEPSAEHRWLQRLVGEWTSEMEHSMGADDSPHTHTGEETATSLGAFWVICEGRAEVPGVGPSRSIMTLGFDPETRRFTGTFVSSMMTHLWHYDGALDETGRVLVLDCEGPDMQGGKGMVPYQDIIELVDDDHRILRAQTKGPDGSWVQFMETHYRRKR